MDQKTLARLKDAIFDKQVVLKGIYELHGNESLFDYVSKNWVVSSSGINLSFLKILGVLLENLYDQDEVLAILDQLKNKPLVSTIDHHGLLNHPFFLNSNLIFSLKPNLKYLICLTTSGISLNNSSRPGCLLVSTKIGLKRFSFFPDRLKTLSVFSAPTLTLDFVVKVLHQIQNDNSLNSLEKTELRELIDETFSPKILKLSNFSQQACLLSSSLWAKFFPKAPRLIYLPLEDLVSKIISEIIIPNHSHILHQLLFTQNGWQLIEKYFQPPHIPPLNIHPKTHRVLGNAEEKGGRRGVGSLRVFSGTGKGSFLFWGIDKKGRRVHLQRQESGIIHSTSSGQENEGLRYQLEPQSILAALKSRKLYPTTLVCFLTLLCYQITCLGGFNQVNWLSDIKERFLKLLEEIKAKELADKIRLVETKNFAEANLAFLLKDNHLIKATGIDILLQNNDDWYLRFHQLAKHLTVRQSIESELPEIYRIITSAGERDPQLLSISDQEIAKFNAMEKKIKSFLSPD